MFMNVLPARDMVPVRLFHYLERAVYMELLPSLEVPLKTGWWSHLWSKWIRRRKA